jgi:Ca2+-binding EF-hand superfamily protein
VRQNRSLFGKVIHDARALFVIMDRDGDGVLSLQEFAGACRRLGLGLSEGQVHTLLTFVSQSHRTPSVLTYDEYVKQLGVCAPTAVLGQCSSYPGCSEGLLFKARVSGPAARSMMD